MNEANSQYLICCLPEPCPQYHTRSWWGVPPGPRTGVGDRLVGPPVSRILLAKKFISSSGPTNNRADLPDPSENAEGPALPQALGFLLIARLLLNLKGYL